MLHTFGLHNLYHPSITLYSENAELTFHSIHAIQKDRGTMLELPWLMSTIDFNICSLWSLMVIPNIKRATQILYNGRSILKKKKHTLHDWSIIYSYVIVLNKKSLELLVKIFYRHHFYSIQRITITIS